MVSISFFARKTASFLWRLLEAVNIVCLGFSYEFIELSQSWFYQWFLAKITDFGGEDKGFLAKITNFLVKITDFSAKITDFFIFANVYCAY